MIARRAILLLMLAAIPARAADAEASAPIAALMQALIASMKGGTKAPFPQRYATLAPVVERAFDIPATLQAAIGPRWASLDPAQQAKLLDVFRKFTIGRYVDNFSEYNGEKLVVLPETRMVGTDQVVATQITPGHGDPVRIDYVMRRDPTGWHAIDVLLNGSISQVAVQRSDFRALIGAGDATRLIESLQKKVADLSGGTLS